MHNLELFENYNSSRSYLYHAITEKYAKIALASDALACHGFQRTWPGGKRLKDDHPDYNDSWWMRGISLTRDINYAKGWNPVIFVFDQEQLTTKWKIVPYNWGYSIGGTYKQEGRQKREREEFLITKVIKKALPYKEFMAERDKPAGFIKPLSKYLVGFYIKDKYFDDIDFFMSHPLYMGNVTK